MKKLEKAIEELEREEPFFIDLMSQLEIVEEKDTPTMGTDGSKIFYNPDWIDEISKEEVKGCLIHEVLHVLFLHLYRREKRNHWKFNVASDLAINPIIKNDYGYKLPKGCLFERKYYGLSAEKIYDLLPKNRQKQQGWGDHDKWDGKSQGKGLLDKIKEKLGGKSDIEGEGEGKRKEEEWKNIIKNALNKHRGDLPDTLLCSLEEFIFIPETNWKDILKYYFSASDKDYTFSVRDRRFLESDFILPGTHSEDELKNIVVAFDSSGSIDQETIQKFYQEFKSLLEVFPHLKGYYLVCDSEVHDFGEIQNTDTLPRFIGGGGTSHIPVFKEIIKRGINPKLAICFTDLETEFPSQAPEYPVLWLVPSGAGENSSLEAPFGEVIKIWYTP